MLNKVLMEGYLAADADLRYTTGKTAVCSFRLGVNSGYKKGKDSAQDTLFLPCVYYGERAQKIAPYLTKGKAISIDARLQEKRWEKEGQKKSRIEAVINEIHFLPQGSRSSNGGSHSVEEEALPETPETEDVTDLEPF